MSKIKMGDDEFILYIRKNYPNCTMLNNTLGSLISKWFKDRSVFICEEILQITLILETWTVLILKP